ncbi:MAG: ABC-2 family transporter protein [Chloroflexia bacterium]|nr:ABC-2 family transporter protein [Chloroflexia bacterium]
MKALRLAVAIFSMSLRRNLAYRTNLLFDVLSNLLTNATGLAVLGVIYEWTDTLGGWSQAEAIVLFGTWLVVGGVLWTCIEPNLGWFQNQVIEGRLDDVLLRPVPSIILVSLGTCAPLGLTQVLTGLVVVGLGAGVLDRMPGAPGVLAWCGLLVGAVVFTWASRVALASLTFWAPAFQPEVLYMAVWQLGRYPVSIYRQPVRAALTYILPMALVSTLPAQALTQGVNVGAFALAASASLAMVVVANLAWRGGVRRYTSATS